MAINPKNSNNKKDLFAPPTQEELSMFAPPSPQETEDANLFAPPTEEDLAFLETDIDKFPAGPDVQPTGLDKMLTDEDLKKVGAKYNVDPEKLRTLAPYWDAQVEPRLDPASLAKQVVAPPLRQLGAWLGYGLQKTYQLNQDKNVQKAIDELKRIGWEQKSFMDKVASFATDLAAPGITIGAAAKGILPRIAGSAATGALYGAAGSESDRELEGAVTGGLVGAGLGAAGAGVAKALQKRADDVAKSSRQFQLDLEKAEEAIQKETAKSEELIAPVVFSKEETPLSFEEAKLILKEQDPEAYDSLITKSQKKIDKKNITNLPKVEKIESEWKAQANELSKLDRDRETLLSQLNELPKRPTTKEEKSLRQSIRSNLQNIDNKYKLIFDKVKDSPELITPEKAQEQIEDMVISLATRKVDRRLLDFVSHITQDTATSVEKARETLADFASRQGYDAVVDSYKEFSRLQLAKKAIEREGLVTTNQFGFINRSLDQLSDAQFVLRGIDQKFRTDVEGIHADLNRNYNRSTEVSKRYREQIEDIFDSARKNNTDKSIINSTRIYDALDSGNLSNLTPQERKTAEMFAEFFSKVREEANKDSGNIKGLGIPIIRNAEGQVAYVPKRLVEHEELVRRMEKRVQDADNATDGQLLNMRGEDLKQAAEAYPEVKDVLNAITLFDAKPVQDGMDLGARLKRMLFTRDGYIALQTKAKAAMERTDRLDGVDFLLETNLYKLAQNYVENTMKHKYLRKPLEQLRFQEQRLRALGAEVDAEYVRRLNEDMMGIRKDTMAETTSRLRKGYWDAVDRKLAETKNPVTKGALYAAKAFPSLIHEASRQIHPNVLGYYSLRAKIQNLTQPLTKVAPELGTIYGKELVARGGANLVNNWKRILSQVESTGQIPAEFTKAGERAIADGILRSAIYRVPKDMVDGMAKAGMALFTKGEQINRAITWSVAEQLTKDFLAGNKSAIKAISEFSPYVSRRLKKATSPEQSLEIIAGYLNDKTMYNYNRASMSEFGRTMGPFFSTFSKWPSATLGDMLQILRDKGALAATGPAFRKYIEPLLFLQTIDVLMGERNNLTEMAGLSGDGYTDRQKKLLGSSGLSQSAPIGSIGAIAKGEIFSPPALDAFMKTAINPLLDPRNETASDVAGAALKGAADASMTFGPGAGLFRFLFEDIPTYVTGERPEGRNTLERVIESMRKATE